MIVSDKETTENGYFVSNVSSFSSDQGRYLYLLIWDDVATKVAIIVSVLLPLSSCRRRGIKFFGWPEQKAGLAARRGRPGSSVNAVSSGLAIALYRCMVGHAWP